MFLRGNFCLWEDSAGLLWVVSNIADPDWDPEVRPPPSPDWYLKAFDAVIEVLDPRTAPLVASMRHERRIARICGSELLYGDIETDEGDTRVQVLEPVLLGYDEFAHR